MPKFVIHRCDGIVTREKEIECDTVKEAEEIAWEWGLANLETWAEPVEGVEEDG